MEYMQINTEKIVEYEVDETGAMLYVCDTEETHILNDTAYFLYKSLEEPADVEQLYRRMEQVYDISADARDSVLSDIRNYLSILCEKGLVRTAEERSG